MRRRVTLLISLGLLVSVLAYSQTPNPGQSPTPNAPQNSPDTNIPPAASPESQPAANPEQNSPTDQNSPRPAAPSAALKTFEGRLTKIDTTLKTIAVASLGGKEGDAKDMVFRYGDRTVVVGGDKTVQGLDGKTGALLKITYLPEENNMASRIEISDKP